MQTHRVTVYLSDEEHTVLEDMCEKDERTKSGMIRWFFRQEA